MDKQTVKDIIKEMILDGEIKITKTDRDVYSNEGHHYGQEEALVLSVKIEADEDDWEAGGERKQDYNDGVVLEEIEITGW